MSLKTGSLIAGSLGMSLAVIMLMSLGRDDEIYGGDSKEDIRPPHSLMTRNFDADINGYIDWVLENSSYSYDDAPDFVIDPSIGNTLYSFDFNQLGPGDVVELMSGHHGYFDASSLPPGVVFRSAKGNHAIISRLILSNCSDVSFRNVTISTGFGHVRTDVSIDLLSLNGCTVTFDGCRVFSVLSSSGLSESDTLNATYDVKKINSEIKSIGTNHWMVNGFVGIGMPPATQSRYYSALIPYYIQWFTAVLDASSVYVDEDNVGSDPSFWDLWTDHEAVVGARNELLK